MIYHHISLIGKRKKNEDEIDIIINKDNEIKKKINFFGIYDGHGGNQVSKYLKENLSKYFIDNDSLEIKKLLDNKNINDIFEFIQNSLIEYELGAKNAGSTALIIIMYKKNNLNIIKIMNLGDCRAVLCNINNIAIPLTKDHKPSSYDEYKRIIGMSGIIKYSNNDDPRINGLSVSRSFGDLDSKPYISHLPDIYEHKIINDKFIILGCDGVWDCLTNQEVIDFVLDKMDKIKIKTKPLKNENIAYLLGNYAIEKGSLDNISIIIIFVDDL